jgi:NAD(P)-dependent dehydrogenase (short-subunit alcohol dehydrogenase family)
LGAAGALVGAGYGRNAQGARALVGKLTSSGARAEAVGADLRAPEAADELIDAVESALGPARHTRWEADTNFTAVVGATQVLPAAPERTPASACPTRFWGRRGWERGHQRAKPGTR